MSKFKASAIVAAALLASAPAYAATIPVGASFDLLGSVQVITASTFEQATALDFGKFSGGGYGPGNGTVMIGGNVGNVFEDAGFTFGTVGQVVDIPSLVVGAQNIANFYSFTSGANTLSFNLGSIDNIVRTAAAGSTSPTLSVYGTGILSLTGYQATPGTFSFSTSNTGTGVRATFQSSAIAVAAVPETATWAMFVVGFGLLGGTMRRRRTAVRFA